MELNKNDIKVNQKLTLRFIILKRKNNIKIASKNTHLPFFLETFEDESDKDNIKNKINEILSLLKTCKFNLFIN
jgi:hypothetical protein